MIDPDRLVLRPVAPELARLLSRELKISETLATLLVQRGLENAESARAFLYDEAAQVCADPFLFRDMALAVQHIERSIEAGELIFVHGDYDVDGVCSTVLFKEGLEALGARVETHVPDRFREGYGVSQPAVEAAAERGARLLLTCDCGSSSHSAIEAAHARGMRVVVTDHHSLPQNLPRPEAFINPQLSDCKYPFKPMCGAAIAYKVLCALHQARGLAWPTHFLDLVAVATIADVMPLVGENRGMVRTGLQMLSQLARPGLKALASVAGLEKGPWGSFAVGFGLGPRINAAGRLENASLAVELLLSQDPETCRKLANTLDQLNRQRRELESSMRYEVEDRLDENPALLDLGVVVEAGEDWHQGVVGITASRVVDRYGVPAFIMGRVGDLCKGSARAPENVSLFDAMQLCSDVFVKFGGHARAAGFTVEWDRVDEMRQRLSEAIARVRKGPAPVTVDLELDLHQANLGLAQQLQMLEPLGEGNRSPVFLARRVRLEQVKAMGESQEHLRFRLCQGAIQRKAVAFRLGGDRERILEKQLYYDVLFELEEEVWEGMRSPSLKVISLVQANPQLLQVFHSGQAARKNSGRWLDGRNVLARRAYIEALSRAQGQVLVVVHDAQQQAKIQSELQSEQVKVVRYQELEQGFDQVVLLYPPSCLDELRHPALQQAESVHVLFSGREVRRQLQADFERWLDRSCLEGIWRALIRHANQGRVEKSAFSSIEEDIKPLPASPHSLAHAVEVFEELQLVERTPDSWILRTSGGRRLEESQRYQEMCRGRERLMQFVRRFDERQLRLEDHLVGA